MFLNHCSHTHTHTHAQVNKEQAEKCRDLGAAALRRGEYPRAAKMLQKSLQLFPLPGVEALYQHAKSKLREEEQQQQDRDRNTQSTTSQNGSNNNNGSTPAPPPRNLHRSGSSTVGADGREYTAEHVDVVHKVLQSQKGGRGAHYRVLNISSTATEAEIKVCVRAMYAA